MGLSSSKVVKSPGEAPYIEEPSETYLHEKFTKVKVGWVDLALFSSIVTK